MRTRDGSIVSSIHDFSEHLFFSDGLFLDQFAPKSKRQQLIIRKSELNSHVRVKFIDNSITVGQIISYNL